MNREFLRCEQGGPERGGRIAYLLGERGTWGRRSLPISTPYRNWRSGKGSDIRVAREVLVARPIPGLCGLPLASAVL